MADPNDGKATVLVAVAMMLFALAVLWMAVTL